MSFNQFVPQSTVQQSELKTKPPVIKTNTNDTVSTFLLKAMRIVLVAFTFLLPVFFIPGLWGTLGFQKSLLAVACVTFVIIGGSLLILRSRMTHTVLPLPLAVFLVFLGVALASTVASSDIGAALRGSVFEVQTFAFALLMFGIMVVPLILQQSKRYMFYVCAALGSGLALLLVYVVTRILLGPVLPFGSFFGTTQTPAGNLNDLALLSALTIILSIVAMLQLRLRTVSQAVLAGFAIPALLVLAVVNFLYVWLVVGFFSLLVLLYLVSYDSLFEESSETSHSMRNPVLLSLIGAVCLISGSFVVAGDFMGERFATWFEIEYLEVRPSLIANIDIAQGVYSEDLFLGVGPNQFEQAWRGFKDPAINQTLFWNTDFIAGSGFVPTLFVTLGLLGGVAFVLFHLSYLWLGIRALLRPSNSDSFWYFAGVFSFVGAVFLWGMSYVYVPGATVMLLAALLTGLSLVAFSDLQPDTRKIIPLVTNQKRGFVVMAATIFSITGSMFVLFTVGEQYVAQASFNKAQQSAPSLAAIDQAALQAFSTYPDDRFLGVRARVALLEMNRLFAIAEPTETDQQRFVEVADLALRFAAAAIQSAPENPEYHAILAGIYNNYALAGIEGALERSAESLAEAKRLDPKNPSYDFMSAQMSASRGDVDGARGSVTAALQQKPNFAQALLLLAELDIAAGDIPSAIEATRAILTLEPQNPARYYQLGILFAAAEQNENAVEAYSAAVSLDPNFANARYLRALLLIDLGQADQALDELRLVAETNVDNAQLLTLISSLESGDVPNTSVTPADLISGAEPVSDDSGVTSPVNPDTDLVTPLNTVPEAESSETEIEIVQDSEVEESAEVEETLEQ
ncbi:MAG: tetratricopeptide (TPR) repeat protein [Candidatus Paceibacteria bacterium]|jgi:tetratricopeptide (TPR) repeat protein